MPVFDEGWKSGRLNCDKTPNPRKFHYMVDKKLLVRLKKLLHRTGAKVVLSSTWRCDPVNLFAAKHWGIPFIDVCPDRPKSPRCKELTAWLADHPQVVRFVVIDDEDDELDDLAGAVETRPNSMVQAVRLVPIRATRSVTAVPATRWAA